ncbi:MAG: nucleotide exchange factor GrpE [Cyanobacteria bacterium]|nr:nucleotide exchange factor GrpE [Cyanobacteriota bacterium]
MIDETHPTDPAQEPSTAAPEGLEELREEDAAIDLDLEAAFGDGATDIPEALSDEEVVPSAEAADLARQVAELTAQLDDRTSQYVRITADFENYRRRTNREREEQEVQVKCSTVSELLPVIDNFERARAQIKPQTEAEMTIHKSYQSVYKQLVDCFKRIGVAPMRAEGQEFDPNFHEAVMREPTDQHPEGTVMEELVRGYLLEEKVLRHAMVKVAAPPEPGTTSSSSEGDNSEP